MPIHYECAKCGSAMSIRDDRAGSKGRCPKCHDEFIVPGTADAEPARAAAAHKTADGDDEPTGGAEDEADDYLRMMMSDDEGSSGATPAVAKKSEASSGKKTRKRDAAAKKDSHEGDSHSGDDSEDVLRLTPSDDEEPHGTFDRPIDPGDEGPRQVKPRPPKHDSLAAASSVAGDLLKTRKSDPDEVEKRKSSAAFGYDIDPNKRDKIQIDVAESARVFGKSFLLPLLGVAVVCGLVYWASMSMTKTRKLPPLGRVSGVVTLDKSPVADAELMFIPAASVTAHENVASSYGRTDAEGRYTLMYLEDVPGAVVGDHLVQIRASDSVGRERLPIQYNSKSTLKAKVTAGSNEIPFELTSQK